jgi:histidinol phosphatase-like PHP family hydrolase
MNVPAYDLHNHTIYSGHSADDATVANVLMRAAELRLEAIGISEHVMQISDLASLEKIQAEVRDLIIPGPQVLIGVEMDVDPEDPNGRWVADVRCDYVILSAHGFPQFDLEIPTTDTLLPPNLQQRNLGRKWMQWYGNALARGGSHIMGHPLREPMSMGIINLSDQEVFDAALVMFEPAIEQGIAFELNESFLAALAITVHYVPYLALAIRLKNMGMKFSRGSDSHGLAKLGQCTAISAFASEAKLGPEHWLQISDLPCIR